MPYTDIVGTVIVNPKINTIKNKNGNTTDILSLKVASAELKNDESQYFNIIVCGNKVAKHIFNSAKKGSLIQAHCLIKNDKSNKGEYQFLSVGLPKILRSAKEKDNVNITSKKSNNADNNFSFYDDDIKY